MDDFELDIDLLMIQFKKSLLLEFKGLLGSEIEKRLNENIVETVYARPPSDYYERTEQFKDVSIIKRTVTELAEELVLEVFPDGNEMEDEHESWVDESDQRENLVYYLELGHSPKKEHAPNVHYEPQKFIELTQVEAEQLLEKAIKRVTKKLGLEFSF